jgi:hypothetical protein
VVIMLVALRVLLVLRTTDGDNGPPATAPETSTGATATSVPSDEPAAPTSPTQTEEPPPVPAPQSPTSLIGEITALIGALTGFVVAVTGLIRMLRTRQPEE